MAKVKADILSGIDLPPPSRRRAEAAVAMAPLRQAKKGLDEAGQSTQIPEDAWDYRKPAAEEPTSGYGEADARLHAGTARLAETRANGFLAKNLPNDRPKTGNIIVEGQKPRALAAAGPRRVSRLHANCPISGR